MKAAFVRQQFEAQHGWYQEHYQGAHVRRHPGGRRPGRPALRPPPADEIRLVDITLLPEFRKGGLGTSLLRDLLAEGEAAGKPVTIHVEVYNPAMRLYERLGFRPIEERGPYRLMEWSPSFRTVKTELTLQDSADRSLISRQSGSICRGGPMQLPCFHGRAKTLLNITVLL